MQPHLFEHRLAAFVAAGYEFINDTKKVTLFRSRRLGHMVYLLNNNKTATIIVHPDLTTQAEIAARNAGCEVGKLYFNSNMTEFPKKMNSGKAPTSHGLSISCKTVGLQQKFLELLGV